MIYDLNSTKKEYFDDKVYDICIIGGGVAGITLAKYLNEGMRIILLEAGGSDFTVASQDCYKGENSGFPYYDLDGCRARYLGGTSNWWGGYCHELSEADFEKKPNIPKSGWPICKRDLDLYRDESRKILDLDKTTNNLPLFKPYLGMKTETFQTSDFEFSPPTNFRIKFETTLKSKKNLECFINANVTDLTLSSALDHANSVEITNYNFDKYTVRAKRFVLAAGGIENARLLLNFNKQQKKGIGNEHGLVGSYFSDHPHCVAGQFILEDRPKKAIMQLGINKNGNLNFTIGTTSTFERSAPYPATTLLLGLNSNLFTKNHGGFKEKIRNIVCSSSTLKGMADWYAEKEIACLDDGTLHIEADQFPNSSSMVSLSNKSDAFGLRRVNLKWHFTEQDVIGAKHTVRLFAKTFAQEGIGRIKLDEWVLSDAKTFPQKLSGGEHHMGTTRMAANQKEGVVDSNLKVFGLDNLYIAGSSVFPTYGKVNPTFSIVQLTLRLAHHLNGSTV